MKNQYFFLEYSLKRAYRRKNSLLKGLFIDVAKKKQRRSLNSYILTFQISRISYHDKFD